MESRIGEFELKLSLCEDHIDALNRTLFRQQKQLDLLQEQFRELYRMAMDDTPRETRNLREEIPPHF